MTYLQLALRHVPLRTVEILRFGALLLLFAALFSGKFSFDRFLVEESRVDWLQLRVWLTPLAVAAWMMARRAAEDRGGVTFGRPALILVAAILIYHIFLVGNTLVLGNPQYARGHLFDLGLIMIDVVLLLLMVRSAQDARWFLLIAEAAGVCLVIFSLAGFRNPDVNGPSLAPFGGPITYYRVEFLSFCAALYLWATSATSRAKKLHLVAAVATLLAVFTSLAKAALVSGIAAVLLLVIWLFIVRRYRDGLIVAGVAALAFAAFAATKSEISDRFARVDPTASMKLAEIHRGHGLEVLEKVYGGTNLRFEELPLEQQERIQAMGELTKGEAPDFRINLKGFLEFATQITFVNDGSSRIGMAQLAWGTYKSNRWLGAGMGNYHYFVTNYAKQRIDEYVYPHNIVLEQLAVAGNVGFTLFMLAVVAAVVLVGQAIHDDRNTIFLAACLVFLFGTSLFAGNYYDFRLFWFIALLGLFARRTPANG